MTGKFVLSKSLVEGERICVVFEIAVVAGSDGERCHTRAVTCFASFPGDERADPGNEVASSPVLLALLQASVACYVCYKMLYSPHSLSVSLS